VQRGNSANGANAQGQIDPKFKLITIDFGMG
jgi:hypothetical protein